MSVQLTSFSGVVLAPSHVGFNFQIIFYKVIVLKFIFNRCFYNSIFPFWKQQNCLKLSLNFMCYCVDNFANWGSNWKEMLRCNSIVFELSCLKLMSWVLDAFISPVVIGKNTLYVFGFCVDLVPAKISKQGSADFFLDRMWHCHCCTPRCF